jgi:dihydrolipoamide dehydrogenase
MANIKNFDVLIIGSGPGGMASALRASQQGYQVAIAEREAIGGTGINMGADPSKSLLRNAEIAFLLRHGHHDFGFSFDHLTLDYQAAMQRSRWVAKTLSDQARKQLAKNKVSIFDGSATLTSPGVINVSDPAGEVSTINTRHVIIATGASPLNVPGIPIDGVKVITCREAIMKDTLPPSVLIIGGGALGVEFASIWNGNGSQVTLVEFMSRLVPLEDEEIGEALTEALKARGIRVLTDTSVVSIHLTAEGVTATLCTPSGNIHLKVDQILEAYSFGHNSSALGLDAIGVNLGKYGVIITDNSLSTNIPGVWAVGDVNGKLMLAASAKEMGRHVADNISGNETRIPDYLFMPKVTYCHPQIASFGLTETQALQAGKKITVMRQSFINNGMALASGDGTGFVKIIINQKDNCILGAHLIGNGVSELLPELNFACQHRHTISDIALSGHAHPSLGESISTAAEEYQSHMRIRK